MKRIPTVPPVIFLGSLLISCSVTDKQFPQASNLNSVSSPSPDSIGPGIPTPPYDEMLRQVTELSEQAGIVNLKKAKLADGHREIRIWKGFAMTSPRCFILRIENGVASASFVSHVSQKVNKRKTVYVTKALNPPHSGWDALMAYFREHGIDKSVDLSVDKYYHPDPDGEALVLELRNGSNYSMAYYNDSTATGEGKKAFGICQKIEKEFDVVLGCH